METIHKPSHGEMQSELLEGRDHDCSDSSIPSTLLSIGF